MRSAECGMRNGGGTIGFRIPNSEFRISRALPVGRARHDELVHGLHVPARADEFCGEPVEQLGMRGRLALCAEVLRRRDEARAKKHFPETVHRHARGERMVGRHRADHLAGADHGDRRCFCNFSHVDHACLLLCSQAFFCGTSCLGCQFGSFYRLFRTFSRLHVASQNT